MQKERGRQAMHLSNQDLSKQYENERVNDYVPEEVLYTAGIQARNS